MAAVAMMLGGALVNALAFTGSSFLFSSLGDDTDAERKRHDLALEQLQQAQADFAKRRTEHLDWVNEEFRRQNVAVQNFEDVDAAMIAYSEAFPHSELPPLLGEEPVLTQFYTPSNDQQNRELGFVAVGMIVVGASAMWLFRR